MQTENLTFYHGTGRAAADAILHSGAQDRWLKEIGAFDLGRAILTALRNHAGIAGPHEDMKLCFAFNGLPGSEYSSLWKPALSELDGGGPSHFQYGHFFATLNIGNAYRYALNPYRSEFIRAIAESIRLLRHLGDPLPEVLSDKYPKISHAIENPSPPVVLELQGIPVERLLTAKGSRDIQNELEIWSDMQRYPGMSAPVDFRIQDVVPGDIVAIHDLRDWTPADIGDGVWRPNKTKIEAARQPITVKRNPPLHLTPTSTSSPPTKPR